MKKTILILSIMMMLASLMLAQNFNPPRTQVSNDPQEQFNPSFRERPKMIENMQNCMEELNLTDNQKEKLGTLRSTFEKSRNTMQAEMENLRIDIHTAMKAENYSKAKELTKQLYAKLSLLKETRIDFHANYMKELTKEQKEIMKKNMPNMMGLGAMGKGQGRHGNMGMMMQKQNQNKAGDACNFCGQYRNMGKGRHLNPYCQYNHEIKK